MTSDPHAAHARAEAAFKKKERQAIEGREAFAEYQAKGEAERSNMVRLRALRLARDAATCGAVKPSSRPRRRSA
jgi:hypothetical protein